VAYYTGPVTPAWKLFDDESGQLLVVKVKPEGVLPRTGEMLHEIDKHTHWEVSKVGELTAEDLRKRPPVLYYPIYGHGG
jgi:predicted metal-dependent RNase